MRWEENWNKKPRYNNDDDDDVDGNSVMAVRETKKLNSRGDSRRDREIKCDMSLTQGKRNGCRVESVPFWTIISKKNHHHVSPCDFGTALAHIWFDWLKQDWSRIGSKIHECDSHGFYYRNQNDTDQGSLVMMTTTTTIAIPLATPTDRVYVPGSKCGWMLGRFGKHKSDNEVKYLHIIFGRGPIRT